MLCETYHDSKLDHAVSERAEQFAQSLHLDLGDRIYLRGSNDFGAVVLPDSSLVVLGPISACVYATTADTDDRDDVAEKNNANYTDTESDAKSKSQVANVHKKKHRKRSTAEHRLRAQMQGMALRGANMWLDMISEIVVHQELPAIEETQLYSGVDPLIPAPLKKITREIKLNAPHNQYRYELAIVEAVNSGDDDKVRRAFDVPKLGKFGVLAKDPLRSMQNHVHNLNSLVSRVAIRAGILPEKAYALSDKFFLAAEECQTIEQCIELRTHCARAFAAMIREYRAQSTKELPLLVKNAKLLISRSLYTTCKERELATHLNVSAEHLSRVFKQEVGLTISAYIRQEKLKEAQTLLSDTIEHVSDIAKLLCFQSPTHFTRCFKEFTGLTPRQYRLEHSTFHQG